jgi:hypothetical protein
MNEARTFQLIYEAHTHPQASIENIVNTVNKSKPNIINIVLPEYIDQALHDASHYYSESVDYIIIEALDHWLTEKQIIKEHYSRE